MAKSKSNKTPKLEAPAEAPKASVNIDEIHRNSKVSGSHYQQYYREVMSAKGRA